MELYEVRFDLDVRETKKGKHTHYIFKKSDYN